MPTVKKAQRTAYAKARNNGGWRGSVYIGGRPFPKRPTVTHWKDW